MLVALLACGCASTTETNPPRAATEQLLLSTATDRALTNADYSLFQGKKVYLDATYFDSYDSKYVLGAIRDALSQAGALLVAEPNADIILECRSGALSIDASEALFGIPSTAVPIPLAGTIPIPELALFKSSRQHSYAKFALLAYGATSREHVYSSGPMLGRSYNKYYKLLGLIQWTTSDIPEKHHK